MALSNPHLHHLQKSRLDLERLEQEGEDRQGMLVQAKGGRS
jgi:hypothetical protein